MPRADIRPLMRPHRRALLPQPLFNHRPSWRQAESHTLIEHRVVLAREHGATACCVVRADSITPNSSSSLNRVKLGGR